MRRAVKFTTPRGLNLKNAQDYYFDGFNPGKCLPQKLQACRTKGFGPSAYYPAILQAVKFTTPRGLNLKNAQDYYFDGFNPGKCLPQKLQACRTKGFGPSAYYPAILQAVKFTTPRGLNLKNAQDYYFDGFNPGKCLP